MNVVIISAAKRGDMSGVGRVLTEIFPLLEKKINLKWKVGTGSVFIMKKTKLHPFIKLLTFGILTFIRLLLDKNIKEAEIINGHGIDAWLPTIWLAKIFNKVSVITLHETKEYARLPWFCGGGRWAEWLWNYTMKNGNYFIDLSCTLKKENVFWATNGINLELFKPGTARKNKKTILLVCRLSVEKGIEYFVDACRMIKKEVDVNFVAVTNTSTSARQNKFYTDLLSSNGIEMHRQITPDQMPKFYQEADLLILPSLMEAFPLVIFEAMACGTPVIATNVGGNHIAIKDGQVGYLVKVRRSDELAEKALAILKNDNLKDMLSKNCIEWVKNFTWDKIAGEYLEIYTKVLQK